MFLAARVLSYKICRGAESASEALPIVASSAPVSQPTHARSSSQEMQETAAAAEHVLREIETLNNLATQLRRKVSATADPETHGSHSLLDRNLLVDLQARLERPRRELSALLENRPLYARQQSQ